MVVIQEIRKINSSRYYYQFLLSYFIVFCVPVVVIFFVAYSHFVVTLKNEVISNDRNMLIQMKDMLDTKVSEITKISNQFSNSPEFTPFELNQSFAKAISAKVAMNYTAANEFFYDVVYYLRGGSYLYSRSSTYTLSNFLEYKYGYKNWNYEQFSQDINEIKQPVLRPAEEVLVDQSAADRFITFMIPIPFNQLQPYGTALFLVKEESLQRQMRKVNNNKLENTVILDANGNVVTSLYEQAYFHTPEFFKLSQEIPLDEMITVNIEGLPYLCTAVRSNVNGWTYLTLVQEKDLLKKVEEAKSKAILALIVALLLGAAVIYAVMRINYNPFRNMVQFVENLSQQWSQEVKQNSAVIRQHLLMNLLKGTYTDLASYNAKANELGIGLHKARLFIAKISFENFDSATLEEIELLMRQWRELQANNLEMYSLDSMTDNVFTYICAADLAKGESLQLFQELHHAVVDQYPVSMTIAVGRGYDEPAKLADSYIEASTALEYKFIRGSNQVLFFEDTVTEQAALSWYPAQELSALENYLRAGRPELVTKLVNKIVEDIKSHATTLFMARCICFDLINMILKNMYAQDELSMIDDPRIPSVVALTEFRSVEELAEAVNQVLAEVCGKLGSEQNTPKDGTMSKVLDYISLYYGDPQFSVQNLADELNVSKSYLNKYFKKHTGETVIDHVNKVRIEKAQYLLIHTDTQVRDIVRQIGYSDVSSFIRKFKQTTELTPGEYRKVFSVNK